jgi:N4-gp56 family major capsid protein
MLTNFAALTADQKLVWSRDVWKQARDMAFISKFMGTDSNNVIQRITELTKTEKGEQAIMFLLADLVEDGVVGDDERENREEEMKSYNDKISIDLISHGVRQKGKLAEQKTVIKFRENARDRLSYWLANRLDQLAFLTLSGIGYDQNNDGSPRASSAFSTLSFAPTSGDAPTANRHVRVTGTSTGYTGLAQGDTTQIDQYSKLSYNAIVDIVTHAKTHYIKPLMEGGKEYYVAFLRPEALAQLKQDPDYQRAITTAEQRSSKNPWFTGGTVTVDGLVIYEHRLVYNTKGAAAGSKWGSAGNVDGSRMLVCGAQALGMADLGAPEWSEKWFNYDSSPGVNVDKMFGFLKPKFYSIYDKSVEDFGVLAVDHVI